jgi:hypothetical protein
MPIRNKFSVPCVDCGKLVKEGEGLSEKREALSLQGSGWVTKHRQCGFVSPLPAKPRTPPKSNWCAPIHDDFYEFEMTESEFFGGSLGDNH